MSTEIEKVNIDGSNNNIRKLRLARGLSLEELGKLLGGISRQTVQNYENGDKSIPSAKVKKLADIFGCSTDEVLCYGTENRTIDVTGLSEENIAHIQALVNTLKGK